MSKTQIIEAIRLQNRTASEELLVRCDERSLHAYLERLTTVRGHRGAGSVWVRRNDTPAVVMRCRD